MKTAAHPSRIPEWFPPWAAELSELYFSGSTSLFLLHGNVHDLIPLTGDGSLYGSLADFLAEQVFGRWDLVLYYDLARGLRAFAGRDGLRLKEMVVAANEKLGDLAAARKDPSTAFALLDRFVQNNIMAGEEKTSSAAVLIDHASFLIPSGEPGRLSPAASQQVVTLLNWAASPHVKRLNMAFVLMDESSAALSERVTSNPYISDVAVPMPDEAAREEFLRFAIGNRDFASVSDYTDSEVARLTAGISLVDVNVLIQSAVESGKRLDAIRMRTLKKELIERQCHGLLEFIEPKWTMDVVVGHAPVKQRLRDDAALLKRGDTETLPMGYLVCGPVGTGKTFLAQCMAGEMGVPCVTLRNFRSKYVGETEGNLERVLGVLRAMGPVVVVIDEADAALGDREQEGDSGTSSRVFSMIAAQMGDTRYRGKILFTEKHCVRCHAVGGLGGDIAPRLDGLPRSVSPLRIAQDLWNHGSAMVAAMQMQDLDVPTFEGNEIIDLLAYLRSLMLLVAGADPSPSGWTWTPARTASPTRPPMPAARPMSPRRMTETISRCDTAAQPVHPGPDGDGPGNDRRLRRHLRQPDPDRARGRALTATVGA